MKKTVLVAYDICAEDRRRHALRVARNWRLDGQKSVHECRLTNAEATALYGEIAARLAPRLDHLMFAWVDAAQRLGPETSVAAAAPLIHLR